MRRRTPSPADTLARARETGYLAGRSLRIGPGSLYAQWLDHCRQAGEPAFVAVSIGHNHSRVELVLTGNGIAANLAAENGFAIRRQLYRAINALPSRRIDPSPLEIAEGQNWIEVHGVPNSEAIWLAEQFAAIALHVRRALDPLPANVFDITTARRQRAWKGAIA